MTWPSSPCTWNAYVESGATREERAKRLAEVPEEWRDGVKRHVACEFKIRTIIRNAKAGDRTPRPSLGNQPR